MFLLNMETTLSDVLCCRVASETPSFARIGATTGIGITLPIGLRMEFINRIHPCRCLNIKLHNAVNSCHSLFVFLLLRTQRYITIPTILIFSTNCILPSTKLKKIPKNIFLFTHIQGRGADVCKGGGVSAKWETGWQVELLNDCRINDSFYLWVLACSGSLLGC